MNTGKLIIGVAAGVLLAAVVIFGVYQVMQPRDCGLQLLQESNGTRASTDVDAACREG